MRRFGRILVACAIVTVSRAAAGDAARTNEVPGVVLELSDGSRVIGVPGFEVVPLQTMYARMDVPLRAIRKLSMGDDHETAALELQNGDKLTGVVSLAPLSLATLFGNVTVGIQHVRALRVSLPGGALARKGLILWNRLDSEGEVTRSAFGPGGKFNAGRFVEGRLGKGIELNMQEPFGVTFPIDVIPGSAGCIEFWARLVDFPAELPWGQRPSLISYRDAQDNPLLHLNGNDGVPGGIANGGLCAMLPGIGCAGTGTHGSWTYARALGGPADEWHHYALVWCTTGISGIGDGTRRMAVLVDGRLNTTSWLGAAPNPQALLLPRAGCFGLLTHQGMPSGRVIFDNLKIWNFAKTDFSDRTEE